MIDRFRVANTTTESDALDRRKEILSEYRKNTDWLRSIVSVDKHLKLLQRFRIAIVVAYWLIADRQSAQKAQRIEFSPVIESFPEGGQENRPILRLRRLIAEFAFLKFY